MKMSSSGKRIISSGIVLAFDETSDIVFDFSDNGLNLTIKFTFKNDSTLGQTILVLPDSKKSGYLEFQCTNFSDIGTGTSKAIDLNQFGIRGKQTYLNFWAHLDGDISGKNKTRKIEYTVYQEDK